MLRQAWRSYLASLHPRNLRKAYDNGAIFPLIYWFVIYPLIMNAITDNEEIYNIILGCVFAIVFFTTIVQGMTMKKVYLGIERKVNAK